MAAEFEACFGQYVHLQDKPRAAEALTLLRRIASMVKPIMRSRGWKVKTLAEFYPAEKNLLGLNENRTDRILVRLRHPYDERQFFQYEQVLDTLLHELSHIVFGPHDDKFHALWNSLRKEAESLAAKGYTGEGFLSQGHVLGGKRMSRDEARRRARAAAEKRQTQIKASGQRLGGGPVTVSKRPPRPVDLRRAAADAAEKRADITKGCASTNIDSKTKKSIADRAISDGVATVVEIDDYDAIAMVQAYIDLVEEEKQEEARKGTQNENVNNFVDLTDESESESAVEATPTLDSLSGWTCQICTLQNPPDYLICEACSCERPTDNQNSTASRLGNGTSRIQSNRMPLRPPETGKKKPAPNFWVCHNCTTAMEQQWWTCSTCGAMKLTS